MVAQSVQELAPTLHLPHRGGIDIVRHWRLRWVLVAKLVVADVGVDTGIPVPVLSSGIASMNCLGVVEKVAVAAEESVGLVLYAVFEELIDLRFVWREVQVVGRTERSTRFAKEGHGSRCIAGMMSGMWGFVGVEFERSLIEVPAGQGIAPAYQICGAVYNSFGNLFVGEDSYFEVRRDQIFHSNSQLMVA